MSIDSRSDFTHDQEPPEPLPADYVQLTLLVILFTLGAPINLVSFTKLWRRKTLRSAARLTILKLHLNIADLMILFIYVTSTACWQITFQWRGGDLLCKLIKFLQSTSFQLSSNIMVAVAFDRLVTIVQCGPSSGLRQQRLPGRVLSVRSGGGNRRNSRRDLVAVRYVRSFVYIAWISAIILNLPQLAIWRVHAPFQQSPNWHQCATVWAINVYAHQYRNISSNWTIVTNTETIISQSTYNALQLTFVFWAPAALLILSYLIILIHLQRLCSKEQKWRKQSDQPLRSMDGQCIKDFLLSPPVTVQSNNQKRPSVSFGDIVEERKNGCAQEELVVIDLKLKERGYAQSNVDISRRRLSTANIFAPRKSICSMTSCSTGVVVSSDQPGEDQTPSSGIPPRVDTHERLTIPANIRLVRKKTFRTSMMLIFAYLLFWLPYNFMALWWFIDRKEFLKYAISLKFLNVFIVLNSVLNPFIYGTLNGRWVVR